MRFFIIYKMNKKQTRWWKSFSLKKVKQGVEISIRNACREKLEKEMQIKGENFLLMHEIYYTNTEDLFAIMKENWDIFGNYFGKHNKNEFKLDLNKTIRIRNKVMHSKPILKHEIHDLEYFRKLLLYLGNRKNLDGYLYQNVDDIFQFVWAQ